MTECTEALKVGREFAEWIAKSTWYRDHSPDLVKEAEAVIDKMADSVPTCDAREAAAVEALPDPDKLRLLADWFDRDDAAKGQRGSTLHTLGGQPSDEVQRELRGWAVDVEAVLSGTSPAAAALLARGERHKKALEAIKALPVNQALVRRVEVEAHDIARAALAPGEGE